MLNVLFPVPSADIKRIKMTVDNLYIEKQKSEKMDKSKKPNKGKGKAKLKVEGDNVSIHVLFIYDSFSHALIVVSNKNRGVHSFLSLGLIKVLQTLHNTSLLLSHCWARPLLIQRRHVH